MLETIKTHKHLFIFIILLLIIGALSNIAAMAVSSLMFLFFLRKNKLNDLFVFFLFILILSDNFKYTFAAMVKPFFLILLLGFLLYRKAPLEYSFFKWFIPFFLVVIICLTNSFSFFTSFQKSLSYALLLITIPSFILESARQDSKNIPDLIRLLVVFCILIILFGMVFYFAGFNIARVVKGRTGGLFGNPNGLGVFCFLTTMFITIVYHLYDGLFSYRWKVFSYCTIVFALFFAASRGGMLSSLAFICLFFVFVRRQYIYALFGMLFLAFFMLMPSIELNNFQDEDESLVKYLRLDQKDVTSGRDIAWNLALKEIHNGNYWISKGFGYSEYYMRSIYKMASGQGHQGNVHNSYLTIWLDVGLIGLILFIFAWVVCFWQFRGQLGLIFSVFSASVVSTNVESWLAASLNPFTIYLLIILTVVGYLAPIKKTIV